MSALNKYIKSATVNLFSNNIFNEKVELKKGLNIISGVNGTGKTEFIKKLKAGTEVLLFDDSVVNSSTLKIFAISPKRKVDSKTVETIIQEYKTQNKSTKHFEEFIKSIQIKSSDFDPYPTFPELFVQAYEHKVDTENKTKTEAVKETEDSFNQVLQMVFPEYRIVAEWMVDNQIKQGGLSLQVQKYGLDPINHENLSTGEREVLALIFSIYASKDYEDIVLVDEPEIHLNWNLEKGLFIFLDWFCTEFEKQIVVVTHSRIIFDEKFSSKTQYFVWREKRIRTESDLPSEEKSQISGEAIQTLNLILSPKSKTFIVEDDNHKVVLSALADVTGKDVEVIVANNRSNVEMFYQLAEKEKWQNLFFLVDGDNQGKKYNVPNFIQLEKYCIQNYFLNPEILADLSGKTQDEVKTELLSCLGKVTKDNKSLPYIKLSELTNINNFPFEILDTFDASKIVCSAFSSLGLEEKFDKSAIKYIEKCKDINKLEDIFSEITSKL